MNPRTQLAVAAAGVTLLSSTALHSAFVDTGWVAPVVGAVLAVLVGAEVGSRLGQHLVARPLWRFIGSGLGALFYLTAVWAHQGALLGFIPRGHTWHLFRLLFDKSFTEVHDLATPAPTYRALMLLTATGVAMVAIAVDQLSVRAPLIGLPLLALYSVPEWLAKDGTGWLPLALGGAGYVGLLIREGRDRTSRWGRTVTGATALGRNRSAAGAMSQAGWRIGAAALGVALVVPPLVPDVAHFNLAKGGGVSASAVVHYNTVTNLSGSLNQSQTIHLYSYTTSAGYGEYLRMAVADTFCEHCVSGGAGFSGPSPQANDGVDPAQDPVVPGGVDKAAVSGTNTTQVSIGPQLGQDKLPVPIGTTDLSKLRGQWSYEQSSSTVFSDDKNATRNQLFTATSDIVEPAPATVEKSVLSTADKKAHDQDRAVPGNLPTVVASTAKSVTKGAKTEYEQAVELQDFFTNGKHGFSYSLKAPNGSGYQPLASFLTDDRQGFCQQYASAMAMMARSLGIPARVAFGFTVGNASGATYSVNNHDAHSWPELYFTGLGWLRFEPTPRTDNQTATPGYGQETLQSIRQLSAGANSVSTVAPNANATPGGPHPDARGAGSGSLGHSKGFSLPINGTALAALIVLVLVLLALGSVPLLQASRRQRRRRHSGEPRQVALLAWQETLRDAFDLGFDTSDAESPRQTARRLTEAGALTVTAAEAMQRLARAVERARYATEPGDPHGLLEDAETVHAALSAVASRRARLRARTLPPSTLAWAGERKASLSGSVSRWAERVTARTESLVNRVLQRRPA